MCIGNYRNGFRSREFSICINREDVWPIVRHLRPGEVRKSGFMCGLKQPDKIFGIAGSLFYEFSRVIAIMLVKCMGYRLPNIHMLIGLQGKPVF